MENILEQEHEKQVDESKNTSDMASNIVLQIIRYIACVIVVIGWATVGFVLWVPLLVRMIIYFIGVVSAASFRGMDLSHARSGLDFAIEFYVNGFRIALTTLDKKLLSPVFIPQNYKPISFLDFIRVMAINSIWTAIFWGFSYFMTFGRKSTSEEINLLRKYFFTGVTIMVIVALVIFVIDSLNKIFGKKCPYCGKPLSVKHAHCSHCGKKV